MTERRVRDIDVSAPIIYRDTNETIARLNKVIENGLLENNQIHFSFLFTLQINWFSFVTGYVAHW